ncbi:ImpB/MucB/SamB family protein [Bifidobacterium pseudocatenulatum]|mgnify:FL=1|uniref:ImpB/MucB/SamB family protein n=1 Tax=Bifidobacterium pseudocatenulatum TaxID=28026 RepID=UPI0022E1F07C|nr:ImpB/MucB/SamB family protein [Bifidobacterium pseudocatenulatum]
MNDLTSVIQRTVQFYWLRLRSRDGISNGTTGHINWMKRLSEFREFPWENKILDNIIFDSVTDKHYPVLTVFEQFQPNFMQLIDQEHKRVTDFMDSEAYSNTNNLAKSSAFAFFPKYSLVSRVSGNAGKSVDPLKKALNYYWPEEDYEWDVIPVITADSIERFKKELRGIDSLTASFTTKNFIDKAYEIKGNAGEFYQEIAQKVGADLDIDIRISLTDDTAYGKARRVFKDIMQDFIISAVNQNKKVQVSGPDFADKLLELNLVSHPVVEQSEITISNDEPRLFTGLINHLIAVSVDKETYLYDISKSN